MKKCSKKKDDGKWFAIIVLVLLFTIIILELSGQRKDPQLVHLEELCQDLCQKKGLQMDSIGFREPCGAPDWQECLICFCYREEDVLKQESIYFYERG